MSAGKGSDDLDDSRGEAGAVRLGPRRGSLAAKTFKSLPRLMDPRFLASLRARAFAWMRASRDAPRLLDECPWIRDYQARARETALELAPSHARYITTVSRWGMAVSLELAVFLLEYCRQVRPDRVLDLGSGFSTFVFHKYAAEATGQAVHVLSVDDDPGWLEKTRSFLESEHIKAGNLVTWQALTDHPKGGFDLLLFDLGLPERRAAQVEFVLGLASPHGRVVLDDQDHAEYHADARRRVSRGGRRMLSLRPQTLDMKGRYSALVV